LNVKGALVAVPNRVVPLKKSTLVTVPSLSLADAVIVIFAGAVKLAPLAGLVMLTVGGELGGPLTVIVTAADVVAAPALSVALAVSVYVPAARFAMLTLYGAVVSVPTRLLPLKKSTFATVPSLSAAVAFTVTLAGAVKVAPLAGLVMLTVGGTFGGPLTVIVTAVEVVIAPPLSVALAVRV